MKIGVGGPPNSGKSTFTWALYRYLDRDSRVTVDGVTLDIRDQTLKWLLGETEERKDEDADFSEVDELLQRIDDCEASIIVCDLPGRLEPPIRNLAEPLDVLIILANDQSTGYIKQWEQLAEEFDIDVYGRFVTYINTDKPSADWDAEEEEGVLRELDRDAVNQDYLEALPADTKTAIQMVAGNLKETARTEYR